MHGQAASSDSSARSIFESPLIRIAAIVLIAVIAGAYAYLFLPTRFRWADDEGFMLTTLQEYLSGRPLYDGMYTEYGPFFYLLIGGLFSVTRWTVTHDAGRLITLACWLATSGVWAYNAWLWRRSPAWSVAVLACALLILKFLASNPGHPQM